MTPEQLTKALATFSAAESPVINTFAARLISEYEIAYAAANVRWPEHQHAYILRMLQALAHVLTDPGSNNVRSLIECIHLLKQLHPPQDAGNRTYADKTGVPSASVRAVAESLAPVSADNKS